MHHESEAIASKTLKNKKMKCKKFLFLFFAPVFLLLLVSCKNEDDYRMVFCGEYLTNNNVVFNVSINENLFGVVHIVDNKVDDTIHVEDDFIIDRFGCLLPSHDYNPNDRLIFQNGVIETTRYGEMRLQLVFDWNSEELNSAKIIKYFASKW